MAELYTAAFIKVRGGLSITLIVSLYIYSFRLTSVSAPPSHLLANYAYVSASMQKCAV
ncbi:MAG: hypothetical protein QOK29_3647 [Rhodospirillaceae bacterium]|jgi:hypothetical protein|nr:hypothetical protein [Rhodospirillaceae bacterium]